MPFRKTIGQALRRIVGIPNGDTTSTAASVAHKNHGEQQVHAEPTPENQTKSVIPSVDTSELVLYGRPSCPYCLRVDRVIDELKIEDKITRRHTGFGTEWRKDLRERTGSTQVPCLFINGKPMFESMDIIAWLKANFEE